MAREVKFRIWSVSKQKMYNIDSFTCNWENGQLIIKKEDHLMQFIGLTDAKGKEIYEGDIVECWGGEQAQGFWEINIRGEIVYSVNAFVIKDRNNVHYDFSHYDCQLQVIANIHENPKYL